MKKAIILFSFIIFCVNIIYAQRNSLLYEPELLARDVYKFYQIDTITLGTPYAYFYLYLESESSGERYQVFLQDEEPDKDMKKLIRRGKLNKLEVGNSYELQLLKTGNTNPGRNIIGSPREWTYMMQLYRDDPGVFLPMRLHEGWDYYIINNSWGFYVYDPDESYGRDINSVYMFPKPRPSYPVRVDAVMRNYGEPRAYERNMPEKKD